MNPTIARIALDWFTAERKALATEIRSIARDAKIDGRLAESEKIELEADAGGGAPTPDELMIATDRVYQVLRGEVRWSEASPGDRAVWRGRMRDIEKFESWWRQTIHDDDAAMVSPIDEAELPPVPRRRQDRSQLQNYPTRAGRQGGVYEGDAVQQWPVPQRSPRLRGYRERRWWNFYDTARFEPERPWHASEWLFGNKNVGDRFLTNLDVAGQFGHDTSFVILAFYVDISDLDALRWVASNTMFQFFIGARPETPCMFVRDLFMGIPLRRPLIIPPRQNFSCRLDYKERPPADLGPFDLVFHVDGLLTTDVNL